MGKHTSTWCSAGVLPPDAKPEENLLEQIHLFYENDDWNGCGVCASTCPENAVKMVRKPEEEIEKTDAIIMESSIDVLSKVKMTWDFGF